MIDNQLSTPTKSTTGRRKWVKAAVCAGLVIILALIPLLVSSPYIMHILILTFIYTIASVSMRTIAISGQFPLAHAAFMGIGAYASTMASKWLGWSPWITIPVGGLVAMGIGVLTGYPFARLRALYYALGSLFFGVAMVLIISAGGIWTGGYSGITGIPPLFTGHRHYYYFFLGLALVSIIALYRFEFSRIGTILKAIARSHLAASSIGINERFYRILAMGLGCFFVGLAGAGYAHWHVAISPNDFGFMATLWLCMYMLIGGIDSFAGPIIGTFILILIPEYFRDLQQYAPYISAGLLIIVVYLMPQGLASLPKLISSWYIRCRKGERGAHVS